MTNAYLALFCALLCPGALLAAQPVTIANACGVPVHHALVEIGSHKPPQVFTPELNNGRMEFNYLAEGTEPLTAMCFRTADEGSLFRVLLPQGLRQCVFVAGALTCTGTAAEALSTASAGGMPPAVAQAFLAWNEQCAPDGTAEFSDEYLTVRDIDGDGHDDYILNGDGATCVENGKVVARGGGNGGTNLQIFTHRGKAVSKALDVFTQGAEVRAHKGFATVKTVEGTTFRIAKGKAANAKPSKGGVVVYTLRR
ncbi:hypothetical protein QE369_000748 [Agrobacterium larrymoorei]|uniref:VCBS repeat-containing protein n=1 Tax=Agrobacterium larrymoorei TaxID=160699 RepID=A0AAJ2EPX4_9HYPH|nr:hypothetical protein [Agrobacterium larrymoorei]MDR6100570.1 hypothetical protein [Agrobacterium larrymoorei]